jgi:hypothetical protein
MQNGDPTPMRRRLVSRRDEPVVCESCGAKVERRMHGQRFCSSRYRDRARIHKFDDAAPDVELPSRGRSIVTRGSRSRMTPADRSRYRS